MPPKPKRNWFDVQVTIMALSLASALGLWNLFAGPDREAALRKAAEAAGLPPEPVELSASAESPVQSAGMAALPQPGEKIMLGGAAPQTQVIVQAKRKGGGGGAPDTTTGSS